MDRLLAKKIGKMIARTGSPESRRARRRLINLTSRRVDRRSLKRAEMMQKQMAQIAGL